MLKDMKNQLTKWDFTCIGHDLYETESKDLTLRVRMSGNEIKTVAMIVDLYIISVPNCNTKLGLLTLLYQLGLIEI